MKPTRRVHRRKQSRRKRKGGKKLGEGKYGFVVDPAIACVGKDTSGYVSKVFKTKEEFDKVDRKVIETIKTIPDYEKYFILPEFCEIVGELSEENKKDGVTEDNKRNGYLLKRGGESLEDELKEHAMNSLPAMAKVMKQGIDVNPPAAYNLILGETVKHLQPKIDNAVRYLKPIVKEVFQLRDKLYENGISHGDLHPGNVLRMSDGTLRIIDFDRAVVFDPKNPNRRIKDFQMEDGQQFIESAAWIITTKEKDDDTYLDILRSNLAQKIVDELSG